MKKQLLFTIFCVLFCCFSQAQTFQWTKIGGANKMVRANTGNFYAANGQFIAKYDSIGNLIWQNSVTGFGINGIDVDSIGNLYVTGNFYGTVFFGSYTLTSDPDARFSYKKSH